MTNRGSFNEMLAKINTFKITKNTYIQAPKMCLKVLKLKPKVSLTNNPCSFPTKFVY